jgi:hypothetical protein
MKGYNKSYFQSTLDAKETNTSFIQGDRKFPVHLMITIQKVTSNVQSVPRQSADIYCH